MILARHAQALFWAGRYLERAESTARCFEIESNSIMYLMPDAAKDEWLRIVASLGLNDEFAAVGGLATRRDVASFLLSDLENPGSVVSSVTSVRENLRMVRDRIPIELWDEANSLHLALRNAMNSHSEPHDVFLMVRRSCQALSGVLSEAMRRDEGHAFIVLGRMLERCVFTVGLLGSHLGNVSTAATDPTRNWLNAARLLRLTSSLQAFRRAYGHRGDPTIVAEYLLSAQVTPRSVLSSLMVAKERLTKLVETAPSLDAPRRQLGLLCARLELSDRHDQLNSDAVGLLEGLSTELQDLADAVLNAIVPQDPTPGLSAHYVRPGTPGAPAFPTGTSSQEAVQQ